MEPFEAVANGAVVGESAAQPALADIGHARASRLALDGLLGLALGADEEDQAAPAGDLGQETISAEQATDRFFQVDNVNEIALAVDERPHLRVPAAGPMSEMNARFDQFLNLDNCHAYLLTTTIGEW